VLETILKGGEINLSENIKFNNLIIYF